MAEAPLLPPDAINRALRHQQAGRIEAADAGCIELGVDAREAHLTVTTRTRTVRPVPGLMVMVPSYLYHRTFPLRRFAERMAVSVDVYPFDWRR